MACTIPRFIMLLFLTLLAPTAMNAAFGQQSNARVALLIGNAAYPDAAAPLRYPISNVRALAKELRRDGFEVDVGENLTKEAMKSAFDRFYGKIKSDTVALLFFSGYGIQSDRRTYMVPVDAQIWLEADLRRDAYSLDAVLAEMNKRGARVKIAILDASRRNPFERRFRAVAAGLAPVIAPHGTVVLYAAGPGMVVREGARELFVNELLKQIRDGGKVEEAFNRTLAAVSRATQNEQVPWFSSSLVEQFSFAPSAKPSQETQTAKVEPDKKPSESSTKPKQGFPTVKVEPEKKSSKSSGKPSQESHTVKVESEKKPSTPDSSTNVRDDYLSARNKGTKKSWQDFIDKYPSGYYSELARDQLAKLEPPPATKPPAKDNKDNVRLNDPDIRKLDKRIRVNPNDGNAYYKRGQIYAKNGYFDQAINDFGAAIRLDPEDAEALNNRCWLRAIVGKLQAALRDCNKALRLRPRYADAFDSRGFVNLKIGKPFKALADYNEALRIKPKSPSSLYGRGIAKKRSGKVASANADIRAAKAIQPNIADEFADYGVR